MSKPIAIDLFAGGGMMSLGFSKYFQVSAALELSQANCEFYRNNFSGHGTTVIQGDVRHYTGNALRRAAGIPMSTDIGVVFGGAPCQPWSVQGLRQEGDERRGLTDEFVRMVDELNPRHFVFENVKGLTLNTDALEALLLKFRAMGYDLAAWQICNAKDYGVAQHRERLFLLGSRRGLPVPSYPKPTGRKTCKEAIGGLENPTIAKMYSGWETVDHSPHVAKRFSETPPGRREPISRFTRLAANGVSPTLLAGTPAGSERTNGGRHTAKRPIHYKFDRVLTTRELARIHSIPDSVEFPPNKAQSALIIGNSVPPLMAKAIAKEVSKALQQGLEKQAAIAEREVEHVGF